MALFVWHPIYSVGNDAIDKQHQRLFEIANRFQEAYERRAGIKPLSVIFNELIDYAATHFADEERLMRECAYPDYPQHKANHEKLVSLVLTYKKKFEEGEEGMEQRAMDFIRLWLNGHILGMDRSIRPYVKGVAKEAVSTPQ